MVLEEDMVSRQHAKVSTYNGDIIIVDLDSTNGTMVNGQPSRATASGWRHRRDWNRYAGHRSRTIGSTGSLPHSEMNETRGIGERLPSTAPVWKAGSRRRRRYLCTLRRLLASSKPASLALKDAAGNRVKIYMCDGAFCWAKLRSKDGEESVDAPRKALYRGLAMREGSYRVRGFEREKEFPGEMDGLADDLLIEAEAQRIELEGYADLMPGLEERLELVHPLETRLADLNEVLLDTLQLVLNEGRVRSILDQSTATDLETWQDVLYLLQNDYIVVAH